MISIALDERQGAFAHGRVDHERSRVVRGMLTAYHEMGR